MPPKKSPASRLEAARTAIGWSRQELAARLRCTYAAVVRYEDGSRDVPPAIVAWLETLAAGVTELLRQHPAPDYGRLQAHARASGFKNVAWPGHEGTKP